VLTTVCSSHGSSDGVALVSDAICNDVEEAAVVDPAVIKQDVGVGIRGDRERSLADA
jgi:hypothetical protein